MQFDDTFWPNPLEWLTLAKSSQWKVFEGTQSGLFTRQGLGCSGAVGKSKRSSKFEAQIQVISRSGYKGDTPRVIPLGYGQSHHRLNRIRTRTSQMQFSLAGPIKAIRKSSQFPLDFRSPMPQMTAKHQAKPHKPPMLLSLFVSQ